MILSMDLGPNSYDIIVERGALCRADRYFKLDRKVLIVTDSGVPVEYAKTVAACCKAPYIEIFPEGEQNKNMDTYQAILSRMVQEGFSRTDCVVAVGGGVTGDMAGFAAASYMRGIDFYNIPTTLLSQVDSSIGGKVAIDFKNYKNIVGAFYQPKLVLCDTDTLTTLPLPIFRDGCAEVIKYAVLFDPDLFSRLQKEGIDFQREDVIARCVEWKRRVVAEDEFDRGIRQLLNLGHTIGHGVEASSHFSISHGSAVAIGMAIIARSAAKLGICDDDTANAIAQLLQQFDLPISTDFTVSTLFDCTLSDKKRIGAMLNLIIPQKIGKCGIYPTPIEELKSIIQAGL
jgi:3-dehydroquinate synthase